jgi:hypothetical protein
MSCRTRPPDAAGKGGLASWSTFFDNVFNDESLHE